MNLIKDIQRHVVRFVGTALGVGLLLSVVIAMQGIYAGMVDDATLLTRAMHADLWLVQRETRGPFAEASRVDPSLVGRAAAIPGVHEARPYTYQVIQRERFGQVLRIALVGLGWPDDIGRRLPLEAGRFLGQAHGEMIADASLGVRIGDLLPLAGENYRVVGLTRNALTSGGDSVAFVTVTDSLLIANDIPSEATRLERERVVERLGKTDLGRSQPGLSALAQDPQWHAPAQGSPPIGAVLLSADPIRIPEITATIASWGDSVVFSQKEEEVLLLGGVVQRARMQIGLFTVILTLTAAVIVMMVIYNMTLEKTHDLAVLKLMGAPVPRLLGVVFQQAWVLGAVAYGVALVMGEAAFPLFPRRVLLTDTIRLVAPCVTFLLVSLASLLGLLHVLKIDPAKALEG